MTRLRSLAGALFAALLLIVPAAAASAQTSADTVAQSVADNGFYIGAGTDVERSRVSDLVSALRSGGEAVSLVVLADEPPGGSTTFAGAVFDRVNRGIVVVVGPQTVGWEGISEVYDVADIEGALDAALDGRSDTEILELFAAGLLGAGVPESGTDNETDGGAVTGNSSSDSSGGSGLGGMWLVFGLVAAAALAIFFISRRNKAQGSGVNPQVAEARTRVQTQIDAVANDIIDMEDEVRTSGNAEAQQHYRAANEAYGTAHDQMDGAATPQAVLDLANKLDRAIWHLDAAEALLDGNPVPQEPTPQKLPEPTVAESAPSPPVPYPTYDRRPGRRSTYGGGLGDSLAKMAMVMMASRTMRPARRGPARRSASSRSTSRSTSSSQRRASGGASRSSGTRGGTGGRARGGGRRRG